MILHYKEFKQFEKDDEAFWAKLISGDEPETPSEVRAGNTRLSAGETSVIVKGEIVDGLWEEDFASLEDQHIITDLRERLKLLGLDPSQAEEVVKKSKSGGMARRPAADKFAIQPQRELQEIRKRVYEQSSRLAKILLNHVSLDMNGKEIPYKYTSLGVTGRSNFIAAVMMVNHEFNKRLGKDRNECSTEEFNVILESLDGILQTLVRRLKKAQSEYEKRKA